MVALGYLNDYYYRKPEALALALAWLRCCTSTVVHLPPRRPNLP